MNEAPGELIALIWDGRPDAYYVNGHVTSQLATHAMIVEYGEDFDCTNASLHYLWAQWIHESEEDADVPDGCTYEFRTSVTEQPGWFPVTELVFNKSILTERASDSRKTTHEN